MEKKFDHPFCIQLLKHFFGQFKTFKGINIFLAIIGGFLGGFITLCGLEVFTFIRAVLASVFKGAFDYMESKEDDKVAYRVALTVVLSPFILLNFLLTGIVGLLVFVLGFAYDVNNTIMSLGKTETLFVNLK